MLRFESVFWATKDKSGLQKRLLSLGFSVGASRQNPEGSSLFFGPESIELFSPEEKLETLHTASEGIRHEGIVALGLETDHIALDYGRLSKIVPTLEKPRRSSQTIDGIPNWFGFGLPPSLTPQLKAWVVMKSGKVLESQTQETLPQKHPNSCFGIEAIHLLSVEPEPTMKKWAELLERPVSHLQWAEIDRAGALRFQSNERFFDVVTMKKDSALSKASHEHEGVFMLTLKVADLELAKNLCKKAGAQILNCRNRDGFIVPGDFTGGPALRFVRTFWKRYLPAISKNFPEGRRTDFFRPLGGADSSTLRTGFHDDWTY